VKVEEGKYSIAEIVDWFKNKSLVVNSDYQRAGGLWPTSAKSYFIDTILKDFPFPKVYFHERADKESTHLYPLILRNSTDSKGVPPHLAPTDRLFTTFSLFNKFFGVNRGWTHFGHTRDELEAIVRFSWAHSIDPSRDQLFSAIYPERV
jgi:hypothetical protein